MSVIVGVLPLAAVLLSIVAVVIAARRANELFVVRASSGEVIHVRGRVPRALLAEFCDVLRHTRAEVEVRVVAHSGTPVLELRGKLGENTQQQLRNVLGLYPIAQIRSGARPARKR